MTARSRSQSLATSGDSLPLTAIVVTVLVWGLVSPLIKSADVTGAALAFYRLAIGAAVLLVAVRVTNAPMRIESSRLAAVAGLLFGANVTLFVLSLHHTTVANATLIGALQPAIVLLVAGRLFGETVTGREIMCVAIAITGVGIVIIGSAGTPEWNLYGDFLAVLAVLTFTAYFLISKRVRETTGTLSYMTIVHVVAALVATPGALVRPGDLAGFGRRTWPSSCSSRSFRGHSGRW